MKVLLSRKIPTLSRGYSPALSGIYGHTTVYNSGMHSFYVYGGVSYSAGRVQVSNALFVLHYPTRRWSVVSTLEFLINVLDQISVLLGNFVKMNKHTGPKKHTVAELLAPKYNF